MGFRFLPYKKAKKGVMIAGVDYNSDSGGGGGGGSKYRNMIHQSVIYQEGERGKVIQSYTVEKAGYYLVSLTFVSDENYDVGYIKHNNNIMAVIPQYYATDLGYRTTTVVINADVGDTITSLGDIRRYASPTIETYSSICEL